MKYAVSEEGVSTLRKLSQAILIAKDAIRMDAKQLKTAGEGQDLGPHANTIIATAELIEDAINVAADPIEEIAEILDDVADGYEEVIGNDRFRTGVSEERVVASTNYFSGSSGRTPTGSPETRSEIESLSGPETIGERAPKMPSPYAEEWSKFAEEYQTTSFTQNEAMTITKAEFNQIINESTIEDKGRLEGLKNLVQSGRITVVDDASDDEEPKQKVRVLTRRR